MVPIIAGRWDWSLGCLRIDVLPLVVRSGSRQSYVLGSLTAEPSCPGACVRLLVGRVGVQGIQADAGPLVSSLHTDKVCCSAAMVLLPMPVFW